ncbi:MAG: pyridoxamine 5'-phosphate oxidase family protein, partial [Chloroflexi bacterium]|nr:pyridoxamine 5'-phosphate oxidase family protein [Chloroflexota bacterium]
MSDEAITEFLQEQRIGVLAINREGRPPQLVPVWFVYDGKDIWLMSEKRVPKITNMRRDPRLSLCVHDSTFPYRAVVVYGTGTLTEENVPERRREIARRY